MPYFGEPVGRVKIQTTSENSQRYYTTKRLIRIYYPTRQSFMSVWANFADIYLRGMRDRSMQSRTELAREIQLTDWSTAHKPVYGGPLAYKYRVMFVLVLGVICTLRGAVG